MAGSLALSLAAFTRVWPGGEEPVWSSTFVLADIGGTSARDRPAARRRRRRSCCSSSPSWALCVQVYSLGYMHKDEPQGLVLRGALAVLGGDAAARARGRLPAAVHVVGGHGAVLVTCSSASGTSRRGRARPRSRRSSPRASATSGFAIGLAVMWATAHTFDIHEVVDVRVGRVPGGGARRRAAAVLRRDGQVGAGAAARVASRRDGGPDARLGAHPRGDDGRRRRLPRHPRACRSSTQASPVGLHVVMVVGVTTALVGGAARGRAVRHQEDPRVLDDQPARLHVRRARRGQRRSRRCSTS